MTAKPSTTRYLRRKDPDHPLADSTGCVRVHRAVLFDKIGPGEHECHWCPRLVSWEGRGINRLVADHLDDDRWNNAPENLVPACRRCNTERTINPHFPWGCRQGHRWTEESTYRRPDTNARTCLICAQGRESQRVRTR